MMVGVIVAGKEPATDANDKKDAPKGCLPLSGFDKAVIEHGHGRMRHRIHHQLDAYPAYQAVRSRF